MIRNYHIGEIEGFLKISSHDLQEPLRKLLVFGDMLKDRYASSLEAQGKDYIERMQKAADHMRVLIGGLVSYSQVTTKSRTIIPVDISGVLHNVISDMAESIEEVSGRVEIGELPVIDADPLQMHHLFQYLIGNALKYRKQEEPPIVKIYFIPVREETAKPDNGPLDNLHYQITIEDNGIGFKEEYAERIFGVFQRLHDKSEYEGAGISLSICKKIVEGHGGNITAKSVPGQGTKLIVMLPARHVEEDLFIK